MDSIISNIDRTAKNTNLLNWNKELWLIDHGASFYFHHNWDTWQDHLTRTFPLVKTHVLLNQANDLTKAAEDIKQQLTKDKLEDIVSNIPEDWLIDDSVSISTDEMRQAYIEFINTRLSKIDALVKEAEDAR